MQAKRRVRLSVISTMHYVKLVYRSLLLLGAAAVYIVGRVRTGGLLLTDFLQHNLLADIIWLVFVVEMICRFFPSRTESMGCQKQFAQNYIPVEGSKPPAWGKGSRSALAVLAAWLALNGAIGALYFTGVIDEGILLLVSLVYSVCDMVCILFFCPFQTWFMKNKCCTTCRIYNWDYPMMFTPLIFVPGVYTWSIVLVALGLLARWEITYYRHPEWFYEKTNERLACAHCEEKLCHHKKALTALWNRQMQSVQDKLPSRQKGQEDSI